MKLLHYFPTTRLTEGGTVRAAIDLCTALARRGHSITWLTTDDTDVPESWKRSESDCPTVELLGPLKKSNKRLTNKQISHAVEIARDADIAHIHAMWMPSNPQMAKACRMCGTPWVLSTHGMLDDWCMQQRGLKKRLYLATVGRAMLKGATTFLTTAEEERRQSMRWLPHDNVAAIPLIVDLEPYRNIPDPNLAIGEYGKTDFPTVLFLSRVHEKKSIETLIDAAAILLQRKIQIRVLIAGTGEQSYIEQLQNRAASAGLQDAVSFLGMVVGDLKLSLFAMADIFTLPTQQENFGLVYPEAMLCGTPVITTKGTDIWRELEEGGGALIVDRTPEAFADAIELFIKDNDRLISASCAGREHVLRWLDTDSVATLYEAMYDSAINGQQS